MLRSRLPNQRCIQRFTILQRRNFHPSPVVKSTSLEPSNLLHWTLDSLHASHGLPILLIIPLIATVPHAFRLLQDRRDVRQRFAANFLKPLQGAISSLNKQRMANGQTPKLIGATWYTGGGKLISRKSFILEKLLPFTLHTYTTAGALWTLRSNTSFCQTFQRESISDLITWLCGNDIGQKLISNISVLSSDLGFQSIPSIPLPLLASFCFYQYFQLLRGSQFWKGWSTNDISSQLSMSSFSKPGQWLECVQYGQLVIKPVWLYNLQAGYTWDAWKIWFRAWHSLPPAVKLTELFRVLPFAIVIPATYEALMHAFNMNSAQFFYLAVSSTLARLRTRIVKAYEVRQAAELERENQKWERLEPTSKKSSS